jgi:hypothetical protein
MPYQAQYAQMGSPKTAIDDILNLDGEGEYQSQNIAKKYIRDTMPSRQAMNPEQMMQMRGRQIPTSQQMPPTMPRMQHPRMVEDFDDDGINIGAVATRIFPSTAAYINAIDDRDHPLHAVAVSLLGSGNPNCDKTVYIIVIIILCIAIACMIYKMNRS